MIHIIRCADCLKIIGVYIGKLALDLGDAICEPCYDRLSSPSNDYRVKGE